MARPETRSEPRPQTRPDFSPAELERYARHLVLAEMGGSGQQKLKRARVLVVGAGGLGTPVLQYLTAAGIGTLRFVDDDRVNLSDLHRQVIFDTDMVGKGKAQSAAATLGRINPHCRLEPVDARFSRENAAKLLEKCDLAIDACDNFETRYALADECEKARIPLISAAVNRFDGTVTILKPWMKDEEGDFYPRYRDLFPPRDEAENLPTCSQTGVLGAMVAMIGSVQALEAVKEIAGIGEGLVGKLLMIDGLSLRFHTIKYRR